MNERLRRLRRTSPYADDELVVGFKKDVDLLVYELLKEEPHRCVISILGMGGLGKTTLARKLYNNSSVKGQFECCAWVSVSKEYNTQDLLQRIRKSFRMPTIKEELEMLEKMTEEDLERHLREFLEGCRYLVVIDDVWETEAWESLRKAFPDSKDGSRVIVTTRIKAVAERLDERAYVHELAFLKEEESWELFCKKVFPNYNVLGDQASDCPPILETLGRDMARRCGGLPLAIVVLGGLLSRKHHDEWHKVRDQIWLHVRNDSIHVMQLLALSLNDLPCQLKSCFLYLGSYPEDFEIDIGKLLRLWVAEGFIQPGEGTLEEEAIECLNELIDRNLVQVAERKWRRIEKCRVHDLLRDLAIEKAKELNILHIYDRMVQHSTLSPTYRRLASHLRYERFVSSDYSNPCLRTLLFTMNLGEIVKTDQLMFVRTKFKLLRVLDLGCVAVLGRLPDAVGKLIHLRYLGLGGVSIKELPPSIGNLRALQTIDAQDCMLLLPNQLCNAKQLRHIMASVIRWPFRVDNLRNLHTLNRVTVDGQMEFDPMNLINLRELSIRCTGQGFTLDSIGELTSLRTLDLHVLGGSFSALQPLSHCQNLLQLKLKGSIGKLPTEMHEFPPNLKYLYLNGSKLKEDPMPTLEKLPNLTILDLVGYRGKELACMAGGFSQLQVLQLHSCVVEEFRVDEGGMPLLKGFQVRPDIKISESLRSIPLPKYWDWPHLNNVWPY